MFIIILNTKLKLQQYLPFTVLKPACFITWSATFAGVATVLTVYGIETNRCLPTNEFELLQVATVLTVYGIETCSISDNFSAN